MDKDSQLRPLALNPAQQDLLPELSEGGRVLVVKARQLGISTLIQAYLFRTALNRTARVGTLAHDHETTQKLRDMTQLFWEELPDEKRPKRGLNSITRTYFPETQSWLFFKSAGNPSAGRGGTYSHVHGSEVAYWRDAERIMAGLLQGVPQGGQIILESTANGTQGWFYDQVMKALEGDSIWKVHFLPWWMDGRYRLPISGKLALDDEEARLQMRAGLSDEQIAWRRQKRLELGEWFAQEYPEDPYSAFLASGAGYFALPRAVFSAQPAPVYLAGHRYVAGLDFGQTQDYTVLCVLDATTREQVDLLRIHRLAWADMRRRVLDICQKWGVQTLVAEANSLGTPNIEALLGEFAAAQCPTAIVPFQTTHSSKATLMGDLRLALEEGGLKLLAHAIQKHELERYTRRATSGGHWQLSAPTGEHDDCVIALALAWHAAGSGSLVLFGT